MPNNYPVSKEFIAIPKEYSWQEDLEEGADGMKQALCHGYHMMEQSNGDVLVLSPNELPIARTVSFREAVKIVEAAVKADMLERTDGTEDPFQ